VGLWVLVLLLSTVVGAGQPNAHVLLIGIDGARPDALVVADTPNLDALMTQGRWSLSAQTQRRAPTLSGPGWASVLTGVEASKHGVLSNQRLQPVRVPTLFSLVKKHGMDTSLASAWSALPQLIEASALDVVVLGSETVVGAAGAELVDSGKYGLVMVHLDAVDHVGHQSGFTPENQSYLAAISETDARVGALLRAVASRRQAKEDWLVVVTTDHGGSVSGHGDRDAANRTIFVILSDGRQTGTLVGAVTQMDVAPTVLSFLGVPLPRWMAGRDLLATP